MTITLNYKYIMHDIDQWTYRLAKMRIEDDSARNEAQSSSVATDVSYYRRKIEESIANIRTMLKNRLATKNASGSDTLSTSATSWTITITDGAYYCDGQALADLMHKYVVRNTVANWAITYAPDSAAAMAQEAEQTKQAIITEVYTRKYPTLDETPITATKYTLTVTSDDETKGTVTGGGEYTSGYVATIKATPKTGYAFDKWNDNNTDAERTVTVTSTKTYTATFKQAAAS